MLSKSQVKYIQSLGQKKFRDEYGVFVAEGSKIVNELLQASGVTVQQLFALNDWIESNQEFNSHPITEVTSNELQRISFLTTPNQVLAVIKKMPVDESIVVKDNLTLVLDTIQDPGNLGSIIRIADWFGVKQIVCSLECADVYNQKVVQATMGSIARIKVMYVDILSWLTEQKNIRIYATALKGRNIKDASTIKEGIIIIGNESKGIHAEILERANVMITIPRYGKAESLNAAVATGIILSHII